MEREKVRDWQLMEGWRERESQRLAGDGGMEREKVRDWQLMEG